MSRYISRLPGEGDITLIKKEKRHRLSHEILGLTFLCFLISAALCLVLWGIGTVLTDYLYEIKGIIPTDVDYAVSNMQVIGIAAVISALFFAILFLIVLGERLVYIKRISDAIRSFDHSETPLVLPLEGSNELTTLAETINSMAERDRRIREKETQLNEEREQLVRSLSHDIRTPLTSVMSYSQLLLAREDISGESREYAGHICQKALQIKQLTDVLLEGGKRELVHIEDIRLLCEQLVCDLEAELEEDFDIRTDVECPASSAEVDISEIRRIFDNLITNIRKYADPAEKVTLKICSQDKDLVIEQSNSVKQTSSEGHGMGLKSIRRIAGSYDGSVSVDTDKFEIKINLPIL